jgi:putative transposase
LILNRRHLERVLCTFVDHYNRERPHRALGLRPPHPDAALARSSLGEIRRRDKLGGLLHEYYNRAAA